MRREKLDKRPLSGIRVFELGTGIAGPIIARYLAHFGAEVIKVEPPDPLDNTRAAGALWLSPEEYGRGVWGDTRPQMNEYNAGKRSVVLNLKVPEGLAAAKRIVAKCDLVLSNFRPRAVKQLGLDYESVRAVKPDIVYLQMTGYGGTPGPYADYLAWGKNLSALTGIDELTGWPDRMPTGITRVAYPDQSNGLHGLVAVLAALDHWQRTGEGQIIDLSQFESTVAVLGPLLLEYEVNGHGTPRNGNRHPTAAPHGVYPCRGKDRWVALAVFTEDDWKALCRVTGHWEWTEDPRLKVLRNRLANQDELDRLIAAWTMQYTNDEVAERLQRAGVPAAPVLDYPGLLLDPQFGARGFWSLANSYRFGKDLFTGVPFHLSATAGFDERAGPALGEDNDYVLTELGEYSPKETEDLIEKKATRPMSRPEVHLERPYWTWLRHLTPNLPWPGSEDSTREGQAEPNEEEVLPSVDRLVAEARGQSAYSVPARSAKSGKTTNGPLAGYRVLDLADESGIYGTKLLADLGAEVIRIEPLSGDRVRRVPPLAQEEDRAELSLFSVYMNTNKRSLTLNLESAEGQALFRELAKSTDVIYETFPPGYLSERGIGYQELSELNPGLVWVAVTPFGQTGPRRDWKGSDLIAWATAGLLYTTGDPDRPPLLPGGPASLSYSLASLSAVSGTILALCARRTTGRGQMVDASIQESACAPETAVPAFLEELVPAVRTGTTRPVAAPNGLFACQDGYVAVAVGLPHHWDALAAWIKERTGITEVLDPALRDNRYRIKNRASIDKWLEALTSQFTKQALFEEGQRRGFPIAPVNTVGDISHDPQLEIRNFWEEVVHPALGRLKMAGAPYRFSKTPWQVGLPPTFGQDNESIYCGELGLSGADLATLRANGVI